MLDQLTNLLEQPEPPPFALLSRADGPGVELLFGDVVDVNHLSDLPILTTTRQGPQVLALVPYRQIAERAFACHDDGTPLRCLRVHRHLVLTLDDVLGAIPEDPVDVTPLGFDVPDDEYADMVRDVVHDEIGLGEGANFVIRRDYHAQLNGSVPHAALRLFRRLLAGEPNAYWTFAVHTGDVTMAGASPERHVSVTGGTVVMNPISGTYRFGSDPTGPTTEGLLRFLADAKETEELFMVVDEELKMMSQICDRGGRVIGPYLKEMGHLVHTEYLLEGRADLDVPDVLRETMFAPTVTGSPVENAARIIARHEPAGRGYYAGVAALIGQDAAGRRTLDAPILIRTAYIDPGGRIRVPVGATLVRHSVAEHEVEETHAKAAGMLTALGVRQARPNPSHQGGLADHPDVDEALALRNAALAPFWLREQGQVEQRELSGRSVLIVDAEDGWTAMLAHLFRRLGMSATVVRWDAVADTMDADLLVAGPGPGDPRDTTDLRIRRLRYVVTRRLRDGRPLLAVCLSHQILADLLGLPVTPLARPHQGTQREIDLFGWRTRAGFYNTFTARTSSTTPEGLEVAADTESGEVHALRGSGFVSVQFHLESILSTDGIDLLADLACGVLSTEQRWLRRHRAGGTAR